MSSDIAESLATEIAEGTYAPSQFDDCAKPALPVDQNPQIVRFKQFNLFVSPRLDVRTPKAPEFLILRQYDTSEPGRKPIIDKLIKPLSGSLRANLGTRPSRAKLASALEPLKRAGFAVEAAMMADINDLAHALEGVLTQVLLPDAYQPFQTPHPHFALCATYEQVWELKGYTRGELISSISLAPGEQLTLDIHSWDKSTMKSEQELASEEELRVADNLTQRDAHTVTRELAKDMSGKLTASGVTIPGVPASFGGDVSGKIAQSSKNTTEKIRERTVQASHALKSTRKLRIEVSREVGREQRQTRVVANTNRCHTLNCHYFEIMANYVVTTKRVALDPCLLLPMAPVAVTAAWVLCHEDVLKQVLLDKVFLDGFDAARVLEANTDFEEIVKEQEGQDVQPYVDAIVLAYETLLAAVDAVKAQSGEPLPNAAGSVAGPLGSATAIASNIPPEQLRQALYMAMLATDLLAWNALKKLKQDVKPASPPSPPPPPRHAGDALKDFLAVVGPAAYRPHLNASLSTGLSVLGISSGTVSALIAWGYLMMRPDDAELYYAVKAADKKIKAMAKAADEQPTAAREGFSTMEVAKARVAFDALKCHIEDNWLHYLQAMWRREDNDQQFLRLQGYGAIAGVIENDMLGFLGHKAAFRVLVREAVKPQIDFDAIISQVPPEAASAPQLITLPTQGTLLEAMVGECDACEDFIQQSRVLDLRVQEAKAKREESEANRYAKRVEGGDYSDPKTPPGGKVIVNVDDNAPPTD